MQAPEYCRDEKLFAQNYLWIRMSSLYMALHVKVRVAHSVTLQVKAFSMEMTESKHHVEMYRIRKLPHSPKPHRVSPIQVRLTRLGVYNNRDAKNKHLTSQEKASRSTPRAMSQSHPSGSKRTCRFFGRISQIPRSRRGMLVPKKTG